MSDAASSESALAIGELWARRLRAAEACPELREQRVRQHKLFKMGTRGGKAMGLHGLVMDRADRGINQAQRGGKLPGG